jgi:hypothetical protein
MYKSNNKKKYANPLLNPSEFKMTEEEALRNSRNSKRISEEFCDYDRYLLEATDYISASINFHLKEIRCKAYDTEFLLSNLNDSDERTGRFSLVHEQEKIKCVTFTTDNLSELEPVNIEKLGAQINLCLDEVRQRMLEATP